MSSEQTCLQVSPKLFGVNSWRCFCCDLSIYLPIYVFHRFSPLQTTWRSVSTHSPRQTAGVGYVVYSQRIVRASLTCLPTVKIYRRHRRMRSCSASQEDYRLVILLITYKYYFHTHESPRSSHLQRIRGRHCLDPDSLRSPWHTEEADTWRRTSLVAFSAQHRNLPSFLAPSSSFAYHSSISLACEFSMSVKERYTIQNQSLQSAKLTQHAK